MASETQARVFLKIEGRVQGVLFRASAMDEAVHLGLKGWVRNAPDGSVEVVAEGTKADIDHLIAWCHHGPPAARVHHVQVRWEPYANEFKDFHMRW